MTPRFREQQCSTLISIKIECTAVGMTDQVVAYTKLLFLW